MRARTFTHCILPALFLACAVSGAAAQEIGSFVAVRGDVQVRRASAGDWKSVVLGAPSYGQDEMRSGRDRM